MKKYIFILLALITIGSLTLLADEIMRIRKTNGEIVSIPLAEIDKIYFDGDTDKPLPDEPTEGEIVDLGLSVKWRSMNVGAESPSDCGAYFAWGELEEKSSYTDDNYQVRNAGAHITCSHPNDVAFRTLGSNWRMPSKDEFQELIDRCTWTWTTVNEMNGYLVTGPNGNSIFLPAVGEKQQTWTNGKNFNGDYWTETHGENLKGSNAYSLGFGTDSYKISERGAFAGMAVRPVYMDSTPGCEINLVGEPVLTDTSVTFNVDYTWAYRYMPLSRMVRVSTTEDMNASDATVITDEDTTSPFGSFTVKFDCLKPSTTYYYQVVLAYGMWMLQGPSGTIVTKGYTGTIGNAVDLGLSVKWSDVNVGASAAHECGGYYAWGELYPDKDEYNASNYVGALSHGVTAIAGTDYDVAATLWGNGWRMPSKADFEELIAKCNWEWTTVGEMNGYRVTGPNGNSIFLPATGDRAYNFFEKVGRVGRYWSTDLDAAHSNEAMRLWISDGYHYVHLSSYIYEAGSIRPVKN